MIWEVGGVKRVLDASAAPCGPRTPLSSLCGIPARLAKRTLPSTWSKIACRTTAACWTGFIKSRMVEWDKPTGMVTLGPPGRKNVEDRLLR